MTSRQTHLFESQKSHQAPLAYKMRPEDLQGFQGQQHIKSQLQHLDQENPPHIIFSGPPGCGKTTLAMILANQIGDELLIFNAVLGGVNELRTLIKQALETRQSQGKKSIIFIDEIHRFNKAQQDALLPYLEKGDFTLFGATTENPNTTLNKAILSRVQTWRLHALNEENIFNILTQSLESLDLTIDFSLLSHVAHHANGDARHALNQLETLIQNIEQIQKLPMEDVITKFLSHRRLYDKNNERHYDVISAFIKSIRGSDVDAAILWLAVMIDGGEDIEFIARRLIILASEDIGNADPRGLQMATSAHYAIKTIGMPEARIILAQVTTYLARAPKSNASYLAIDKALEYVKQHPTLEVPSHLRNHHPDKKNYLYPHAYPNHWVRQDYHLENEDFFQSSQIAYEKMQDAYLEKIQKMSK